MVHDMHTRRRRPDYLQTCPTGPPVDGVKSALTPALWPCAALWPCTFCNDPADTGVGDEQTVVGQVTRHVAGQGLAGERLNESRSLEHEALPHR